MNELLVDIVDHPCLENRAEQRTDRKGVGRGHALKRARQPRVAKEALALSAQSLERVSVIGKQLEPLERGGQEVKPFARGRRIHADVPAQLRGVDLLGGERRGEPEETAEARHLADVLGQTDVPLDVRLNVRAKILGYDSVRRVEQTRQSASPENPSRRTDRRVAVRVDIEKRLGIVQVCAQPSGAIPVALDFVERHALQRKDAHAARETLRHVAQDPEVLRS